MSTLSRIPIPGPGPGGERWLPILLRLSAALAATAVHPGRQPRLRRALEEAVEAGASEGERRLQVEEALVQAYLFLGFPAALNGIGLWRQVTKDDLPYYYRNSLKLPEPDTQPETVHAP